MLEIEVAKVHESFDDIQKSCTEDLITISGGNLEDVGLTLCVREAVTTIVRFYSIHIVNVLIEAVRFPYPMEVTTSEGSRSEDKVEEVSPYVCNSNLTCTHLMKQ